MVNGRLSVSTQIFFVKNPNAQHILILFHSSFFIYISYPIFELWNVFSRGLIIMASTIFYPTNRWYTHITIMSVSLFITGASMPYVDNESNMVSVLFCVIDILGAISAWQSSNAFLKEGNAPTPGFQTVFVIALVFALLVVVVLAFKAMG